MKGQRGNISPIAAKKFLIASAIGSARFTPNNHRHRQSHHQPTRV